MSAITNEMLSQRLDLLEKQIAALLANDVPESNTKKQPKSIKKQKTTDDDKPKTKRISGYILYSKTYRDEVKDSLSTHDYKPKNTEIMCKLAQNWKALDDHEREQWNTKAKAIANE